MMRHLAQKVKFNICQQIIKFKLENNYTNKELSEIIGVGFAVTSRVLHCQIDRFKIDSLLSYYFCLIISSKNVNLIKKLEKEVAEFLSQGS